VLLLYILVDPDGYVYDKSMVDAGTPVENALITDGAVTIYEKSGDDWLLWPASLYQQTNPQVTDGDTPDGVLTAGYYSFLTPSGQYRIEANAPGYLPYQSEVLTVITTPVHLDIPLIPLTAGSEIRLTPADLSKSAISADPEPVYAGGILTYDLFLRNNGQMDTGMLTLDDPIPAYTTYVDGSLKMEGPGTAAYDSGSNRITWSGIIPAEAEAHLHFHVRVSVLSGNMDLIDNTAVLSGSATDMLTAPKLKVLSTVAVKAVFLPLVKK
jgi:uncharacterized repeat protein (TIGR01451 family)